MEQNIKKFSSAPCDRKNAGAPGDCQAEFFKKTDTLFQASFFLPGTMMIRITILEITEEIVTPCQEIDTIIRPAE
jgi:hypothetical protein